MNFVGRDRAWRIAREWARKAEDASDDEFGELFLRLRDTWIDIAKKCDLVDNERNPGNAEREHSNKAD